MHADDDGIVASAQLVAALRFETCRIAARQEEFAQSLQRHDDEDPLRGAERHDPLSIRRKPAVKPGPRAESSIRPAAPFAIARSSTNITVAEIGRAHV